MDTCNKIWVSVFKTISYKKHTNSEVKKYSLKVFSIRSEPRDILKIFLSFTDFEPHYSYKIYSYRKKSAEELVYSDFKMSVARICATIQNDQFSWREAHLLDISFVSPVVRRLWEHWLVVRLQFNGDVRVKITVVDLFSKMSDDRDRLD